MSDLTDFLLARIAEDEEDAREALEAENGFVVSYHGGTAAEYALGLAESEGADLRVTAHFARHDPARVLAECEAKRRIVEIFADASANNYTSAVVYLASALKQLSLPYADHPDYRQEWRP